MLHYKNPDCLQNLSKCTDKSRWITDENVRVMLCDLGLVCNFKGSSSSSWKSGVKGTHLYMEPQTLEEGNFNARGDIWALGMIILQMFCKIPAYYKDARNKTQAEIDHMVDQATMDQCEIPDQWVNLVKGCLTRDPKQRYGLRDVQESLKSITRPRSVIRLKSSVNLSAD